MKTTERQRRFVDYYLELGNQVQAAIRAGYSERYARDQAFKILEMPAVKEYYEDRLQVAPFTGAWIEIFVDKK